MRVTSEVSCTNWQFWRRDFVDGPLDEPGAETAAALVGVDPDAFDDRAGGAAPGEPRDDRELEGADDPVLAYGDGQVLVRVLGQPLEGGGYGARSSGDSRCAPSGSSASIATIAGMSSSGGGPYLQIAHGPQIRGDPQFLDGP